MNLKEIIKSPQKLLKVFNRVADEVDRLNEIKDSLTQQELFHNYNIINKRFMKIRSIIRLLIASDEELYRIHYQACKESFIYFIFLEGFSYDINKSTDNQPLMAFIPYNHQISLIDYLQEDVENIHVEKSRRQGASKIFILFMVWLLIFGKNEVMYATHKDIESLDMIEGDEGHNSTFDNVRWLLDLSMFVDKNWRDGADGGYTQQKQINLNGNVLKGAVLGKGTAVGMAGTRIFVDEIDVVCDMFPNQAKSIVGSFSQSVNHIYMYSTYRSMSYPFYKYKNERLPGWTFVELDWRDNPTCNLDWYNKSKAKMGNDPILTARELDRDATKIRQGTVFGIAMSQDNYYTKLDIKELIKVVGADFGGGASLTSFVLAYYNPKNGNLYIDDIIESTQYDHHNVKSELYKKGFLGAKIYADSSCSAQIGAKGYDWRTLLKSVGVILTPVNNHQPYVIHALLVERIQNKQVFINKNNQLLVERFTGYRYQNDVVAKDANSHFGDACTYLYKGLFVKSEIGFI